MALRRAGLEDVGLQGVSVTGPFCQGDPWVVRQRVRREGCSYFTQGFPVRLSSSVRAACPVLPGRR